MNFDLIPWIFKSWLQSALTSGYYDEDLVEELIKVRNEVSGVVERLALRISKSKEDYVGVLETAREQGAEQVQAITNAIDALRALKAT